MKPEAFRNEIDDDEVGEKLSTLVEVVSLFGFYDGLNSLRCLHDGANAIVQRYSESCRSCC